jgi:hypothetical protein
MRKKQVQRSTSVYCNLINFLYKQVRQDSEPNRGMQFQIQSALNFLRNGLRIRPSSGGISDWIWRREYDSEDLA